MARLELEVPEDLLPLLVSGRNGSAPPTGAEATSEVLMLIAVRLYDTGSLSSGAAASLAGIPRVLFLSRLADYGVLTIKMTPEELEEDVANACNAVRR